MKLSKPHIYFWISALIIFIAGTFTYSDKKAFIDINIHDTYYIIHVFHLTSLIAAFYLTQGIIYWLLKKIKVPLLSYLTKIHLFCTVGGLIIYFFVMTFFEDNTEIKPGIFNESSIVAWIIVVILCSILFSQVLFLINVIIGLFKRIQNITIKNRQNHS